MTTRVQKWGKSLALRIPGAFAEEAGLEPDTAVDITVREGILLIAPAAPQKPSLKQMIAAITDENRHDATDWGEPVGREVW